MDTYVSLPTLSNGNALPYLPERMILWTYERYAADGAPLYYTDPCPWFSPRDDRCRAGSAPIPRPVFK